ncbi:MAG TPA: choice-of-anchor Q domain-containing protein, partial [Gemmatimonadaceae bacterium]
WMVGLNRCGSGGTPTNTTFDHVSFYDNRMPNGGTNHLECLGAWGASGLTVINSSFSHCTTFDVFVTTSNDGADFHTRDVTLENDTFADTFVNGTDGGCCMGLTVKWLTSATNEGLWGANVIRHNTFETTLHLGTGVLQSGATQTVPGNLLGGGITTSSSGSCPTAASNYTSNVGIKCGTTDTLSSSSAIMAGFLANNATAQSASPDNYHLNSTSPAIGKGDASPIPTTDQDGVTRGSPSDAGAFQH